MNWHVLHLTEIKILVYCNLIIVIILWWNIISIEITVKKIRDAIVGPRGCKLPSGPKSVGEVEANMKGDPTNPDKSCHAAAAAPPWSMAPRKRIANF